MAFCDTRDFVKLLYLLLILFKTKSVSTVILQSWKPTSWCQS